MDIRTLAAAVLGLATTAQALDLQAVPPERLSGRTLVDAGANFSIDAPEGWTWSMAASPQAVVYFCRRTENDQRPFVLVTYADGRRRMAERAMSRFVEGMADAVRKQGFRVDHVEHRPTTRLFHGAHEITGSATDADGKEWQLRGYAGARGRLYAVHAMVGDAADAQRFDHLVESFRLLQPVPTFPTLSIAFMGIDAALVGTAAWLLFFTCRWPSEYRVMRVAIPILVALALTYVGMYSWLVMGGLKTPDDLDRALGSVAGFAMVGIMGGGIWAATQAKRPGAR